MSFTRSLFIVLAVIMLAGCSPGGFANRSELPPVHLEFRYQIPGAGEVVFLWGVNGWGFVDEAMRPPGTRVVDNIMNTPMTKEGDVFVTRVTVPAWSSIDYGFLVTRIADGSRIEPIWDGGEGYRKQVLQRDEVVELTSALDLSAAKVIPETEETAQISREIRFYLPDAGEVFLVWGIEGWVPLPEELRPEETSLVDGVMHTRMRESGDAFITRVQIPSGYSLDYEFLITKTSQGIPVQVYESGGDDGYHETVLEDGFSEVRSDVKLTRERALPSGFIVGLYLLAGILIILIIGFLFRSK